MQNSTPRADSQSAPYFALYSLVMREALIRFDDEMLRTWIAILTFIDNRGIAFPGVRRLQEITGLRAESVASALDRLESGGFICFVRRNERDPVTGRLVANVYAVPESLVKVNQGFGRASDPHLFRSHGENLHNQNHLLDLESTTRISDPTSVTNVSNQPPLNAAVPGASPNRGDRQSHEGQPPQPAAIWSEFQQDDPQWHSPKQGAHAPHVPPPTPPSLPMRQEMIERMRRAAPGLSGKTAGTLIDRNGIKACVTALTELEAQAGKVGKPAAWLVSMCYKLGDFERRRAVAQAGD